MSSFLLFLLGCFLIELSRFPIHSLCAYRIFCNRKSGRTKKALPRRNRGQSRTYFPDTTPRSGVGTGDANVSYLPRREYSPTFKKTMVTLLYSAVIQKKPRTRTARPGKEGGCFCMNSKEPWDTQGCPRNLLHQLEQLSTASVPWEPCESGGPAKSIAYLSYPSILGGTRNRQIRAVIYPAGFRSS